MKKRLLTIPTSLLLTGAVWPVVTMAEEADSARSLDRNQDGFISLAEADADVYLADQFAILDVNGDGLLDPKELAAQHAKDE
ncbi:MAG: hypothetical protein AB8G18_00405 [Gammaproteobacteria bacterium]